MTLKKLATEKAIFECVSDVIREIGIAEFRNTSFFVSSRQIHEIGEKAA